MLVFYIDKSGASCVFVCSLENHLSMYVNMDIAILVLFLYGSCSYMCVNCGIPCCVLMLGLH